MPSFISQQFESVATRLAWKKAFETSEPDVANLRRFDQPEPPAWIRWTCAVEESDIDGFKAFTLTSRSGASPQQPTVLYFHGGSYTAGPFLPQWIRIGFLARSGEARVTLLDYPKTPEFQAGRTLAVASQAYQSLIDTYPDSPIILMGDSAGAGLATCLALQLKKQGLPLPHKLILVCPFLDLSLSHPEINQQEPIDPLLSTPGLRALAERYAGGTPLDCPSISPIYGDLQNLPPIDMFVAGKDILQPDAKRFAKKARLAGVTVNYQEFKGMLHNWILAPIPEAKQVTLEILKSISVSQSIDGN